MTAIFLTNIIAVIGCIISIYTAHLQKLGYENELRALELEETQNENLLKESKIQIRTSYIVCEMRDVNDLYASFDDCNISMYENELMELYYNSQNRHYCDDDDILFLDDDEYNWIYSEVIFLRIDIFSDRIVKNLTVNCYRIDMKDNSNESLLDFSSYVSSYKDNGSNMKISIGDGSLNDMILIPLAIRRPAHNDERESLKDFGATYKIIYAPQSISYYDELYENTFTSEIRDLLNGQFITELKYYGQG